MSITKKFLFTLLLIGSLFTVACGNNDSNKNNGTQSEKKDDGKKCTKSDECKDGSKCILVNPGIAECAKACTGTSDTTTCGTGACVTASEKGAAPGTPKINVCDKKRGGDMTVQKADGAACTQSSECQSGTCVTLHGGICASKCSVSNDCQGKSATFMGINAPTPNCSTKQYPTVDTPPTNVKVCMPSGGPTIPAKGDGEACTKSSECNNGSKCYVYGSGGKCAKTCTGSGDTASCASSGGTCTENKQEIGAASGAGNINVCI